MVGLQQSSCHYFDALIIDVENGVILHQFFFNPFDEQGFFILIDNKYSHPYCFVSLRIKMAIYYIDTKPYWLEPTLTFPIYNHQNHNFISTSTFNFYRSLYFIPLDFLQCFTNPCLIFEKTFLFPTLLQNGSQSKLSIKIGS